jgi:hypothetical protein
VVTLGFDVLNVMALLDELPLTVTYSVPQIEPLACSQMAMLVLPLVLPYSVMVEPFKLGLTTLEFVFVET